MGALSHLNRAVGKEEGKRVLKGGEGGSETELRSDRKLFQIKLRRVKLSQGGEVIQNLLQTRYHHCNDIITNKQL